MTNVSESTYLLSFTVNLLWSKYVGHFNNTQYLHPELTKEDTFGMSEVLHEFKINYYVNFSSENGFQCSGFKDRHYQTIKCDYMVVDFQFSRSG